MNGPSQGIGAHRGTDELIAALAREAGEARASAPGLHATVLIGIAVAIVAALASVLLVAGVRPDLTAVWPTWIYAFKALGMVLVAGGFAVMARSTMTPGNAVRPVRSLLPAAAFLLLGTALDRSSYPLLGMHDLSVVTCIGTIVLASLPSLAVVLLAMRRGVPTRLRHAGSVAGGLAGSIGALAYTVACVNDGAGYVALWYSVALAIVAAIGAAVGSKALAW